MKQSRTIWQPKPAPPPEKMTNHLPASRPQAPGAARKPREPRLNKSLTQLFPTPLVIFSKGVLRFFPPTLIYLPPIFYKVTIILKNIC